MADPVKVFHPDFPSGQGPLILQEVLEPVMKYMADLEDPQGPFIGLVAGGQAQPFPITHQSATAGIGDPKPGIIPGLGLPFF
jgi:hypothetical protein